jgi:uncharacterized membrane protein YqiK
MLQTLLSPVVLGAVIGLVALAILILPSLHNIGQTEIGLVTKRFSAKSLESDNPIAFNGEAGFQARMLMPGWRFKFWVLYQVDKHPWVQVPAGDVGLVIAQVGKPLAPGYKSGRYKEAYGQFTDVKTFIDQDGQKGMQRGILPPGTSVPIHPVGFMVLTSKGVYGLPVDPELQRMADNGKLTLAAFGVSADKLKLVQVPSDKVGVVKALEGPPLDSGDIACRLGGYADVHQLLLAPISGDDDLSRKKARQKIDADSIEKLLGNKNQSHNNYQDYQAFLDNGGRIGMQHDVLMPGSYALNPFLVEVEIADMLVVNQGETAVIKAYVGLMSEDISGDEFLNGSLVRPGRRGIWEPSLQPGKYALNPHCYANEMVPTAILTLNWADATSAAHQLDAALKPIDAKSREGFEFLIDLQIPVHVPQEFASRVISMVGSMKNLVSEVLQPAVGNHFRDKLQGLPAMDFIQTRQKIQQEAFAHIKNELAKFNIETRGVLIQDVIQPKALIDVTTEREIANQKVATYQKEQEAEQARVEMEKAKGTAVMQAELAKSTVQIQIETNKADALKKKASGEAEYTRETGKAEGEKAKAIGEGQAAGYAKQVEALGQTGTAIVNAINSLATGGVKIMPDVLVTGGGGAIEGLASVLMQATRGGALTAASGGRSVASAKDADNGDSKAPAPTAKPPMPPIAPQTR